MIPPNSIGQKTLPRFSGSATGVTGGGVLVGVAGFADVVDAVDVAGFDAGAAGLSEAVPGFASDFASLGFVSGLADVEAVAGVAALAAVSLPPVFTAGVVASLASLAFAALDAVSGVFTLSGLALALSSLALPVAVLSALAALAADVLAAGLGLAVDGFAVDPAGFVAVDDPVFLAVVFGLAAAADALDVEDVFGVSSPELGVFAFATLKNLSDSDLISDVLHNLRRHLGRPSS
ncbi:hypothetical protein ABM428_01675 [Sulfitobacter sp. TCYB15]|uniref:Uncharacterized protein n=1 Tax=Sulfitobacter sp. TCYB15 TaxID=3229275 RepID=A0AAU8C3E2_9RHOB